MKHMKNLRSHFGFSSSSKTLTDEIETPESDIGLITLIGIVKFCCKFFIGQKLAVIKGERPADLLARVPAILLLGSPFLKNRLKIQCLEKNSDFRKYHRLIRNNDCNSAFSQAD